MDASDGQPNGPRAPYKAPQVRRIVLPKDVVAYAAGAAHGAAPGVHAPIGVALTRDGEVWTWGLVLGDPQGLKGRLLALAARLANSVKLKIPVPYADPVIREEPWQLRNVKPDAASRNEVAK
jgi:hypothetical protein